MVAIGIGDAYGRLLEGKPASYIKDHNNLAYHSDEEGSTIGYYTDDTQQSIAIANHMLSNNPITQYDYIHMFNDIYRKDIRGGYSSRMNELFSKDHANTYDLLTDAAKMIPRNSNGCVMRCLPHGLYPTIEKVKQASIIQTATTHPTIDCMIASQTVSLLAHYWYHKMYRNITSKDFLCQHIGIMNYYNVKDAWRGEMLPCNALQTASVCLNLVGDMAYGGMSDLLKSSVAMGGDVDSSAALCLGLAALSGIYPNDLPEELFDNLENNTYGRDYLIELDSKLIDMFPSL